MSKNLCCIVPELTCGLTFISTFSVFVHKSFHNSLITYALEIQSIVLFCKISLYHENLTNLQLLVSAKCIFPKLVKLNWNFQETVKLLKLHFFRIFSSGSLFLFQNFTKSCSLKKDTGMKCFETVLTNVWVHEVICLDEVSWNVEVRWMDEVILMVNLDEWWC